MRRVTTLALVAGGTMAVVAGGAFARARLRGRGSAIPKPVTGMFPYCTFKLYEGKDHLGGVSDERLPQDVFDFFARRDVNQPVVSDQPVGPDQPVGSRQPVGSTPSLVGSGAG